ncbi:MAG: protein kinase [Pirellulales bacterium]
MPDRSPQLSLAEQIDSQCDRYEEAFRAHDKPRIEAFLACADDTIRPLLLKALLELDIELRRGLGETPLVSDYDSRFPADRGTIQAIFEDVARAASLASSVKLTGVETSDSPKAKGAPANSSATLPLTQLGRFAIRSTLGEGAFGTVYRAYDPQLDRDVALKVPRFAGIQSREERERFLREARAAAGLHHAHICPVHEVGTIDGRDYIVLAFIDGKPLSKLLQSQPKFSGRQIATVIHRLALALQEAHDQGIIHRDLKPANIMINRKGEPVIMDFGLARRENAGDAQISHSGQIMGTPAYMSPEQARGDSKAVGPSSDIYSLGVVLYELLCGRRPFEGTVTEVIGQILHVEPSQPSQFRKDVDPRLQEICLRSIAKNPGDRYATMKELATALTNYAQAVPSETRPPAPMLEPGKEPASNQLVEMLAAISSDVEAKVERAVNKAARSHRMPWWTYFVGSGLMGLILLLGIFFFIKRDTVTVIVNIPIENINDPSLSFLLDDKPIAATAFAAPIELKAGKHELVVHKDGRPFKRFVFDVGAKQSDPVVVRDVTPPPQQQQQQQQQNPIVDQEKKPLVNENPLIGDWDWGWGDVEPGKEPVYQNQIKIHRDGTCLSQAGGLSGSWVQSGNQVVISWANNAKDTVTLSEDGRYLAGVNREGTMPVRGRKKLSHDFISLFNGKDLAGWKPIGPEAWSVREGSVFGSGKGFAHLICDQQFQDFELTGEVYASPKGNGAICFRVVDAIQGRLQRGGYEFQVAGSQGDPGRNYTGGLYVEWQPVVTVQPPIVADNTWSKIRIRVIGNHFQGWVNDRQTFDFQGQPQRLQGRLLTLQSFSQGGEVGYRNLRIRPLTEKPEVQPQKPGDAKQSLLIERIEQMGGTLTRDETRPDRPAIGVSFYSAKLKPNDLLLAELQHLPDLQTLNLWGSDQVTDDGLRHVGLLKSLRSLDLGLVPIGDAGVVHLAPLKQLTNLNLSHTRVTDGALSTVASLRALQSLALDNVPITDEGIKPLGELTELSYLNLLSTKIHGTGFRHLARLSKLNQLWLNGSPVSDEGVEHIVALAAVSQLYLAKTKVTDKSLVHFANMKSLRELTLRETVVTHAGIEQLRKSLPDCLIIRE